MAVAARNRVVVDLTGKQQNFNIDSTLRSPGTLVFNNFTPYTLLFTFQDGTMFPVYPGQSNKIVVNANEANMICSFTQTIIGLPAYTAFYIDVYDATADLSGYQFPNQASAFIGGGAVAAATSVINDGGGPQVVVEATQAGNGSGNSNVSISNGGAFLLEGQNVSTVTVPDNFINVTPGSNVAASSIIIGTASTTNGSLQLQASNIILQQGDPNSTSPNPITSFSPLRVQLSASSFLGNPYLMRYTADNFAGHKDYALEYQATNQGLLWRDETDNFNEFEIDHNVIKIGNHLAVGTGTTPTAPSVLIGTGTGTGGSINLSAGSTDTRGIINVTTGTAVAGGTMAAFTFGIAYAAAPIIMLTWQGGFWTGSLTAFSISTGGFTVSTNNLLTASTTYNVAYFVIG